MKQKIFLCLAGVLLIFIGCYLHDSQSTSCFFLHIQANSEKVDILVKVPRKKNLWWRMSFSHGRIDWARSGQITMQEKEKSGRESSFLLLSFVGAGVLVWGLVRGKKGPKVIVTGTRQIIQPEKVHAQSPRRLLVTPGKIPYWEDRGWRRTDGRYTGYYLGKYPGEVVARGKSFQFFIMNPPKGLKYHPHWQCFISRGKDRFLVHFTPPRPKNVDSGILAIENILRGAEKC